MTTTRPRTTRVSTRANTPATRLAATLIEFEAERRRRLRWARWWRRVRRGYRMARWSIRAGRKGWHRRRPLLPLYLALGVLLLTGLLSDAADGGSTATGIALLAIGGTYWGGRPRTRWWTGRGWSRWVRNWAWVATLVYLVWLRAALSVGLAGTPTPGVWLLLTGVLWFAWWRHHVIPVIPELHEDPAEADDRVTAWATRVGAQGRSLPGTRLLDVADLPDIAGAWEATVQGEHGVHDTEQIIAAKPKIASAYDVVPDRVVLEPHGANPSGSRARLIVLTDRNPAHEVSEFGEDWIDYRHGTVPFTTYPDGERGRIRILRPMSGPSHELDSGDTGSGKSYGMSLGITQVVLTGFAWPIVNDPQDGQSLPAWAGPDGRAPWAAIGHEGDLEEILRCIRAIERAVNARSRVLSRWKWRDEDGTIRRGLDYYDPQVIAETADDNGGQFIPMIDWTLDEATEIFDLFPWVVGANERILRKARKAGIRVRWATQYPSMDQLGKSAVIRQMLASGNVLAYANATRFAGNMVLPSWMPNPAEIPKVLPNGSESMGMLIMNTPASARPTFSRTALVRNKHRWADIAAEKIPPLDRWTESAFGDDYAGWRDRREARDRTDTYASPTLLEAVAAKVAPSLGVAPVTELEARDQLADGPAGTRIVAWLANRGREATTGVIAAALDLRPGTVSTACARLVERGELTQPKRGAWALPDADQSPTEATDEAADTA
jgi:hypothetical protein